MNEITKKLLEVDEINKSFENVNKKISPITILGLSDVVKTCIQEALFEKEKKCVVCLTYNELQAQKLYKNIKLLNKDVIYIPKRDIVTYDYDAQNMDIFYQRQDALIKLYNNEAKIVILSIETMLQPIISKKLMQKSILKMIVANTYNLEEIKEKLISLGYERYDLVEGKGTFSIRGDILDIGISNKTGVRIEFFSDEVDQIRYFDISSQRSNEVINQIKIYPLSEQIDTAPKGSFLEYFADDTIMLFDEIRKIEVRANNILNDNNYIIKDLIEKEKKVPYILENMYDVETIENKLEKFQRIYLESQDIIQNRENAVLVPHEMIQDIDETFLKTTKQEKENKTYRPKKRNSKEFIDGEKVVFSDLKIGDYVVHKSSRHRSISWCKYNKNRRNNKRLYKD